jgi:hypothetical protein
MLLVFTCLAALIATGCRHTSDSSQDISIQEEIAPHPVRVGEAVVSVQLSDRAAVPIAKASIMVEAEMNHPGMAPYFKAVTETAPGHYQAPISFDMAGDWVVLLHITLADGKKMERQMDVRGVEPR